MKEISDAEWEQLLARIRANQQHDQPPPEPARRPGRWRTLLRRLRRR